MEGEQAADCEFAQVGGRGGGRSSACDVNVSSTGESWQIPG